MLHRLISVCVLGLIPGFAFATDQAIGLSATSVKEATLEPGTSDSYVIQLSVGDSAEIVVLQMGIDVVVEVKSPGGKLLASVDSPNGRNGDEVVEVIAADRKIHDSSAFTRCTRTQRKVSPRGQATT